MKNILVALVVVFSPCCERSGRTTNDAGKSPDGLLNPSTITEEILDKDFGVGKRQVDVEARLGKAFRYKSTGDSLSATYYIQRELTRVPELIAFTVHYKNGKIDRVDKTWEAR
jgi:hypothetical protein